MREHAEETAALPFGMPQKRVFAWFGGLRILHEGLDRLNLNDVFLHRFLIKMRKDEIHEAVKNALIKDGWTITDDPLVLLPEEDNVGIDLGAEKIVLAEKGLEKIAVEIKSFNQPSLMYEFHRAIGQYFDYESALIEANETRILYAAFPQLIYPRLIKSRIIKRSIERMKMRLILVDIEKEEITTWIK